MLKNVPFVVPLDGRMSSVTLGMVQEHVQRIGKFLLRIHDTFL